MKTRIHTITKPAPHPRRAEINAFVIDFYSEIRQDPVLGPIFNNQIGDHWDSHFETLTDFWVTVLFGVYSYKGNPFLAHQQTPGIEPEHFELWLKVFSGAAHRSLAEDIVDTAIEKAHRIANSLQQGLFFRAQA